MQHVSERLLARCRKSLLHRCVPDIDQILNETNSKLDITSVVSFLNADDNFRKGLADLYESWREILYLCLVAFGQTL